MNDDKFDRRPDKGQKVNVQGEVPRKEIYELWKQ